MTISYNLAPQPRLRFFYPAGAGYGALAGQPLANGKVYTYSSLNHATPKATYQSNVGDPPPAHTNPIDLDINGEAAIYWEFDSDNPDDLYYIEVYDENSSPPLGTPILTADNYDGVPLPTAADEDAEVDFNYIRNPQFDFPWFKDTYNLKEAISANETTVGSWVGAQWFFAKNNNNTTEKIEYLPFDLGQEEVPDNPINYIKWTVENGDAGNAETFKVIAQPLTWNQDFIQGAILPPSFNLVNLFSGKTIAYQFWARSQTSSILKVYIRQFFGTGGSPTPDVVTLLIEQQLTTEWTLYSGTADIPSVDQANVGTTTQGWVQFEFGLPLNAVTGSTIETTNIQVERSDVVHAFQYRTPAFEKALFDDFFGATSGEFKMMLAPKEGWLIFEDVTSIGNLGSGATFEQEYAYALYAAIYNNIVDMYAPVSGGRGASALEDFDAGKIITLPTNSGRVFGNSANGETYAPGEETGTETRTLLVANLPPHVHSYTTLSTNMTGKGESVDFPITNAVQNTTSGAEHGLASTPFSIMQPTIFFNFYIKI